MNAVEGTCPVAAMAHYKRGGLSIVALKLGAT